ncbi:Mitochondrial asparagine--tRNA ligase [Lachnellula arida]|uniref:asparagine--tRNA ligase n=1 Tax=Lachnellula arida TaxID=1316785 RepID=A0A8T9BLT6_9HELO|nr:Mitochondrial asparagine--tRNA ligase [Lachnellula arida]
MVQPRLSQSIKLAFNHSRNGRRNFSSGLETPLPPSVARLLATGPADPSNVVVNGFIRSLRSQKQRAFASIGDGSSLEPLQALLTPAQAKSLSTGTAARLTGSWQPSPNPKAQSHELHVVGVDILGASDPSQTFPLQKKYHTPEYLRTMPHMRTRIPFNTTLLRLRSECIAHLTTYFSHRDFIQTHTPIITSSDCEGAGEVFNVGSSYNGSVGNKDDGTFFKSPKYLTVSSQLHLEALAQSVGKVWTLSPTFRAEKSDTARHLSEFYMLEAELGFTEDMNSVMDVIEDMIKYMTYKLMMSPLLREIESNRSSNGPHDQKGHGAVIHNRWENITSGPWPRITYTEAIKYLQARPSDVQPFEHAPTWGLGLQAEHERYLADTVGQGSPVFVTKYPKSIKPFYMLPSPTNEQAAPGQETVECFDLLLPEVCEVVGGSMREHRLEHLLHSMQEKGMLPPGPVSSVTDEQLGELKWYVDLRRWGSVPHGGFGLGFDRLLGYLSGVQNIREIVTFPRWVGRCDC